MPAIELTDRDVEVLCTSLGYSQHHIREGSAPYELKQKELAEIDDALVKLEGVRS